MTFEDRDHRIETAWTLSRSWFGARGEASGQDIYLLFPEVEPDGILRGFRHVQKNALDFYTGSVWADPTLFNPDFVGLEENLELLVEGSLALMSLQYEWREGEHEFQVLLTSGKNDFGSLRARLFTRYDLIIPKRSAPRWKFEAVLGHGIDLQHVFGAPELHVGPLGKDVLGVEGSSWVEV